MQQKRPDWLIALPDAETMRAVDRWAIEEQGVGGLELMERAGEAVAREVERRAPDGLATVVCGKGNNGGDGFVAARMLREAGREVTVVGIASANELSNDARENLARLPGSGPVTLAETSLEDAAMVVDALLGTGFSGAPRGSTAEAIEAVNDARVPVVSVDVPSGVDASSGVVEGSAVRAAATVTFHASKPGLWIRPGKAYAGEVSVAGIGIPRGAPLESEIGLISADVLAELPRRGADSTKFSSGHVIVAGGSRGLSGAPMMCAHASMRTGAGYVTACVPASIQPVLAASGRPELMTRALPEADGELIVDGIDELLSLARERSALALGTGLGRGRGARAFARELARRAELALVLDADGLNAHAGVLSELAARSAPTVLTPHAGELGRLLELDGEDVERERLRSVRTAADQARAVVVLKGDDTLIADPRGRVAVSPGGSPALATAGTGDVLTGVIATLLAQGLSAFDAACAGVSLHAAAGRVAALTLGSPDAAIASDVIDALAAARHTPVGTPGVARAVPGQAAGGSEG